MNEETIRLQASRNRREFMRWIILLAANINRPTHSTQRFLISVIQGEYPDVTDMEVRRELDYLESRDLLKVFTDTLGQVSIDLTRHGIDIAEYTVVVDPGIARPAKV